MTSNTSNIKLESSWLAVLQQEFEQPYMQQLRQFLVAQKQAGVTVFPPGEQMFHAFSATPITKVRVVILGQDPYHGPGQAHGLSFSVPPGIKVPPSLVNIYKELEHDLGIKPPGHGHLQHWADQGVLLLNSVLSVNSGQAGSHQKQGWERFTDQVIAQINQHCEHVVFLLWGSYAQKKGAVIGADRHCILKAPHPSPLSAHRGFLGCGHFSKTNDYLTAQGYAPIDWQLPR